MIEVKHIEIQQSPEPGKVRLSAEVVYADALNSEIYWFDYPSEYKDFISTSGNGWLVALLPLAVTLHQNLKINAPVDSLLLNHMHQLQKIWCRWYPHLKEIQIEAPSVATPVQKEGRQMASFFSGGVDAFYTLLAQRKNNEEIQDMITIHGFDIPIANKDSFDRMSQGFKEIARNLNKNLITVTTNIRETKWSKTHWGQLSHGCALAATALGIESKFKTVLIPSTGGYHDTNPWGSHVDTDPLLSSSNTVFIHDEPVLRRVEKLEKISQHPLVQKYLRVCWKDRNEKNCCRCVKCYRTMATLDILGVLGQFQTFPAEQYSRDNLRKIFLSGHIEEGYFDEIKRLAEIHGRKDIVELVDQSFQESKKIVQPLKFAKRMKKFLYNKPLVWRLADLWERKIFKDMIHD